MRRRHQTLPLTLCCLLLTAFASAQALAGDELSWLDRYNVVWNTPSKHVGESMPGGGGSIGLNVWVENGDVLIYVARPDSFEEGGGLLKSGRIRVRLSPNPFDESESFRQELKLRDGVIELEGKKGAQSATVRVWCEIQRPVVHVDMQSATPTTIEAFYENWRMEKFQLNDYNWHGTPKAKWTLSEPDVVSVRDGVVEFYHRNPEEGLFDVLVKAYGMEAVKDQLWNPQRFRTSGGLFMSEQLKVDPTPVQGMYVQSAFQAWRLKGENLRQASVRMVLHTAQTDTIEQWREQLAQIVKSASADAATQARQWWSQFWQRSRIVIGGPKPDPADPAWQVGRNYQLARFMLACNAYGALPTKFNGGLHTFESGLINFIEPAARGRPDERVWGAINFTGQNQRLLYWPMLKSGDTDMMLPQLNFYANMRGNGEVYTKTWWGIDRAASFIDQINYFGIPVGKLVNLVAPPRSRDDLVKSMRLHEHYYTTQVELSWMMFQWASYAGLDIKPYLPFIESTLRFYNEYYQLHQRQRDGQPYGPDGKLVIEPGRALETYADVRNPTDVVTGLKVVLEAVMELPDELLPADRKAEWKEMLSRLPAPIYFAEHGGKRVILPGEKYGRRTNGEIPQLYVLFPYNTWGVGRPDLQVAIDSWRYGGPNLLNDKGWWCWYQNNIFTARMGLVSEARAYTVKKMMDSGRKFPAIWGPGFDQTPDMDHAGSGMIGLQDMLMQESGEDLYLLPAWPKDWPVAFKLHAPWQTVLEGSCRNGALAALTVAVDGPRPSLRLHAPGIGAAKVSEVGGQAVSAQSSDKDVLEFAVAAGKRYTLSGLNVPADQPPQWVPVYSDSFDAVKDWKKAAEGEAVVQTPPGAGTTGNALKIGPGTVLSYDMGKAVRGLVRVRAYLPDGAARGTVEILNRNEKDQKYMHTQSALAAGKMVHFERVYSGVMAGLNNAPVWSLFAQDQWAHFTQQKPAWKPIGSGLPAGAGWVEITLDASASGYVTVSVKVLSSGKVETSRVKAIGLEAVVEGFRYVRLGNYDASGEPMWFDDLSVMEFLP
jgi:hypothetical protein